MLFMILISIAESRPNVDNIKHCKSDEDCDVGYKCMNGKKSLVCARAKSSHHEDENTGKKAGKNLYL